MPVSGESRVRAQAEQRGQRHAVHVARGRGLRGIDVGVGIDPDNADLLVLAAVELGDTRDGTSREGMVATQHQRGHTVAEGTDDGTRGLVAGFGDLVEKTGMYVAGAAGFGNFYGHIAAVGDLVAERFEPRFQTGDAYCRGAHVDSSPAGAEVERDADDTDAPRRQCLGSTL